MNSTEKPPTMMKRRVAIEPIQDKAKRHTTFTKRRHGLDKKTNDFCVKFDAVAAVITISKSGNCFAFGHPKVDGVLERYFAREAAGDGVEAAPAAEPMTEAEKRISEAVAGGAWDAAVRSLGLEELDELAAGVRMIKDAVAAEIGAKGGFSGGESSGAVP